MAIPDYDPKAILKLARAKQAIIKGKWELEKLKKKYERLQKKYGFELDLPHGIMDRKR